MIMREASWAVSRLGRIDRQQDLKPSQQLRAQVLKWLTLGVGDVEGIISASPHTHHREGEEGGYMLDVVCPEPRYGMHVGVFSAVHDGPNAV